MKGIKQGVNNTIYHVCVVFDYMVLTARKLAILGTSFFIQL
jgi:hypothetical protein